MNFHTIDDWSGAVYPANKRHEPMTDEQVDQALSLLFANPDTENALYEFAHHDYVGLLGQSAFTTFKTSTKIIVTADRATCKMRNAARPSPVSAAYLERSWQSVQTLIEVISAEHWPNALIVDTSVASIETAVSKIMHHLSIQWDPHGTKSTF